MTLLNKGMFHHLQLGQRRKNIASCTHERTQHIQLSCSKTCASRQLRKKTALQFVFNCIATKLTPQTCRTPVGEHHVLSLVIVCVIEVSFTGAMNTNGTFYKTSAQASSQFNHKPARKASDAQRTN
jgi:hypothetical protein